MRFANSAFTNVNFVDCPSQLLTNSYCLEYLYIDSLDTDSIHIENSVINKVIVNGEKSNIKKIIIKNSIIKELSIEGGSIIECSIVNLQSSSFVKFDTEFEVINISNELVESSNNKTIINNIEVKFRNQASKGSFSITKEALVDNINFSGINNGNVFIQQKNINVFEAVNFSNTGDIRFENIRSVNKFILRGTSLGGTKFVNVNLSTSKLLQIVDSSFSEIQLINTFIPGNIIAESDIDFPGIREVYRQLKYASSKQGDRIRELEYEALEMQAFTNDTTTPKTKMDELILRSNGWSNRHGQDAYIALYRLIPVTVVVYIMIKLCQGYEYNIEYFGDTFSEYMNFAFNPLHDYNKVFGTDTYTTQNTHTFWAGIAKTLDTLIRIYSGYLIFQFLRAFRKYAK